MKSISQYTGLTNFNPKDLTRYLAAVVLHGDNHYVISYQPMPGYERAGRGLYSLHYLGEGRDCSPFWATHKALKDVFPTEIEKLLAKLPHNQPKLVKAPPIGLRPRHIADEARLKEIHAAIGRYAEEGVEIPQEWLTEKHEIYSRIDAEFYKRNEASEADLFKMSQFITNSIKIQKDHFKFDPSAFDKYLNRPKKGDKYRAKYTGTVFTIRLVDYIPAAWVKGSSLSRNVYVLSDGERVNEVDLLRYYTRVLPDVYFTYFGDYSGSMK